MSDTTVLVIQGVGLPPFATRGATQNLAPIEAAAFTRRTVNGSLVDLSAPQMRKYRSTISCTDQQPPAFNGIWPGQTVIVDCIVELTYSSGSASRPVVPGSSRTEGGFTFYRPRLTMLIQDFRVDKDEYGAEVGWTIELEEC